MYSSLYYNKKNSKICYAYYDKEGNRQIETKKWVPDFYIPLGSKGENSGKINLEGKPLQRVLCNTWSQRRDKLKSYHEMDIKTYGGDFSPENKFILETWPEEIEKSVPPIHFIFFDIEVESELGSFPSPDLAREKINLITLWSSKHKKFWTWGLEIYDQVYENKQEDVTYKAFKSERMLLCDFIEFLKTFDADIWSGWNSQGFDVPYIYNRIENVLGKEVLKRLSPFNEVEKREGKAKNKFTKQMETVMLYSIKGITDFDYLKLYQMFEQGSKDSYALDDVAEDELEENKLIHPNDCSFKEFYSKYWQQYVEYNIHDVRLLTKLEDKKGYMQQAFTLSYKCHCQFRDNFGTVVKLETAMQNFLGKKGLVMHDDTDKGERLEEEMEQFEGAFVKEPIPDLYVWVIDSDVKSMYPNLVMMLNISPDTKLFKIVHDGNIWETKDEDKVKIIKNGEESETTYGQIKNLIRGMGYHVASNNVIFENQKTKMGFIPEILQNWFNGRIETQNLSKDFAKKATKLALNNSKSEKDEIFSYEIKETINNKKQSVYLSKEDYDKYSFYKQQEGINYNSQWSQKILLNSTYGLLGCKFFRYFDQDMAAAVTTSGKTVTQNNSANMNDYFSNRFLKENIVKKNFKFDTSIVPKEVIIYNDTDSCFLSFGEILDILGVEDDFNKRLKITRFLAEILQKEIKQFNEKFSLDYFNSENKILFEQELISDRAIFCKKKKYALHLVSKKGMVKDECEFVGVEIKKSTIIKECKKVLRDLAEKILRGYTRNETEIYIKKFYKEFGKWNIVQTSLPRTCNNIKKFECEDLQFKSGTPQHIRGAIVWNYLMKKYNITDVEEIKNGDKVRLLNIKNHKILAVECISVKGGKLPDGFGITKNMLDIDRQFLLNFMSPLSSITDALGWEFHNYDDKRENIDDLFD